ncbi:unnamed protein product, partial [marine sediment metagenome]
EKKGEYRKDFTYVRKAEKILNTRRLYYAKFY